MREIFGCFRFSASQVAAQAAVPGSTTQETQTPGIELENEITTDGTRNTSDESEPRVSPKQDARDTPSNELENKNAADTRNTHDESESRASPKQGTDSDGDIAQKNAQAGVQKMEATTQIWSKKHLVAAYVMIWIVNFFISLEQGMGQTLTPYVTSHFRIHSLTSATGVMASIIAGLTKLLLAKLIDIWGRPQGYIIMVASSTLGLVLMAVSNSVEVYAASQIFYWIGHNGTEYVASVFIADTSRLKHRGLMFAYLSSPFVITSWLSGPLATAYLGVRIIDGKEVLTGVGWRWCYGTFAIIVPIVALPLFTLFQWNYKKALKAGLITVDKPDRTFAQSLKFYLIEFDAVGLFLIIAGLVLLLLPLNIWSYQKEKFASPMISCMIGLSVIVLIAFALWERFGAKVTFIPFHLLRDRTVLGANLLAAVIFFGFYMWNGMFISFLRVVADLDVTEANYVNNIYSIGSCFWSLAAGIVIARTGRFKAQALFFGIPVTLLGAGLMIHWRQPNVNIGFIIMCQVLIAFAGGTLVITEQIAVMAATTHQYVAVVLAIQDMFSSVGGAIGSTVSTAIWTGTFRNNLLRFLPPSETANVDKIYSDLSAQLSYPVGSPERLGVQKAYGESQKWQLTATVAVCSLMIPCVMMWRNYQLKDHGQVKGTVV